jgi:hypothetical protein
VLIVAYYFPPLGGIGSLRALAHARHLPEYGWETAVLAPRSGAYHRDEELQFPPERVVRSGSLELSRLGKLALRTGGDDHTPAQVAGARAVVRSAAHGALYFPDAQIGWAPFALRSGRRALRERPVDAVVSSSFPITAHVIARRLAREAGVPWIAEFRDPWSETLTPGRRRRRAARLERSLARDAAGVVMTSPSWARHHAELWGRTVDVVPNGHGYAVAPAAAAPAGLVLGYLGTYYPRAQASLSAVWAAAAAMTGKDGPRLEEIRIIGELHPAMGAELGVHGLTDRVRVTGQLPNSVAVKQLASCSLALLAGPARSGEIHDGHVPAKVWEYLATELPVILVGAAETDVARLLAAQPATYVVPEGDEDAAGSALRAGVGARHPRDAEQFSRRARAGELAAVLQRVCAERP